MCGILTITGTGTKEISDSRVNSMLSSLSHRGPDERGFIRKGNAILGHTRLSIVDLVDGRQPMRDNKNPHIIVFNGEIYGYKKLKEKLEKSGHIFSTNSDTEVILKSYAEYGEKCVEYLDGMFAFAIWNEEKDELFMARDRFGKKPFYYAWKDETFLGASEIKAIFESGMIKGWVDSGALCDFLRLGYIPPWKTIYSNIHTLPPAHAGIIKNGGIKTWKYWVLEKKPLNVSYDEAKRKIKELFDEAVKKRMIADVEIGSLLSGGIDSTLVTAYAQKYSPKPLKTFTLSYGAGRSELPFAIETSRKIGTEHYGVDADGNNLDELKKVIEYFDEPHADSSDFPQHKISELASSKVKVVLSGDGADELFMGYGWYQKYWHTPVYKRIFMNPFSSYQKATEIFSNKEIETLMREKNKKIRRGETGTNYFDRINIADLSVYLPGQLLTKVDRTSMMHSLEVRCPFLDTTLAEFVYSLPIEYKMNKRENKIILKDILGEIMPKEFVERRKQGFGAPLQNWFNEKKTSDELSRIVNDVNHPIYRYLNREAVVKIMKSYAKQSKTSIQKIWSLLCLCLWFELHQKYHE